MIGRFVLREPWRTRLLFVSLAGNLFAVAFIGSHALFGGPPHGPPGMDGALARMARDLPPPDSRRFLTVMEAERPWHDMARRRMDEARARMSQAIGTQPYDQGAVQAAMLEWQAAWMEWSSRFGQSMLKALAELSPEGRARLADAGQRPPRR